MVGCGSFDRTPSTVRLQRARFQLVLGYPEYDGCTKPYHPNAHGGHLASIPAAHHAQKDRQYGQNQLSSTSADAGVSMYSGLNTQATITSQSIASGTF